MGIFDGNSSLDEEKKLYDQADDGPASEPPAAETAPADETPPAAPAAATPSGEPDDYPEPEGEKAPAAETPTETEAAAEVAEATEEAADEPAGGKGPRVVPLSALQEERKRRQQTEKELQEAREFKIRMEERARVANEIAAEEARKAAAIAQQEGGLGERPDPAADPIGAMEWDDKNRQRQSDMAVKKAEDAAAKAEEVAMVAEMKADKASFEAAHPDYKDAVEWAASEGIKYFVEELGDDRETAVRKAMFEANNVIMTARSKGKSAAAALYSYAKRMGYQGKQADATETPAKSAPKAPTAAEKLETAAEGNKVRSLGTVPAAAISREVTPEVVDQMSPSEFKSWIKEPKNKKTYDAWLGKDEE